MIRRLTILLFVLALAGVSLAEDWAHWRGPLGTGMAPEASPPVEWSEERNVRWKVEIPGRGLSTPIVHAGTVYVTTAVPFGPTIEAGLQDAHGGHDNTASTRALRYQVLAFSVADGSVQWTRTVAEGSPHAGVHKSGSWASGSAVTDGDVLICDFGSAGLFGLGLDGRVRWTRQLGELAIKHGHGEGSSPALAGGIVVVNRDHEGESFVAALRAATGETIWRVAREEGTSWSSPLIVEHGGAFQVTVAATSRVRSYALSDGALIWECGGLSGNVVASPVAEGGLVHVASSYETRSMLTIRLEGANGDLTGTEAVAWKRTRDTPYVPSPLVSGGRLFFLKHYQGILTAVDAKSGATLFGPARLPGVRNVYASLVGAEGRLYVVGRNGVTAVLRIGDEFEVLATNSLDDEQNAVAVAGDSLFVRGGRWLYRLADDPPPPEKADSD